jgi:CHAD domain-containing protein
MALDSKQILKPVKKLKKLIRKMPAQPTPDEVHDLRANLRRFEAISEALSLDSQGIAKSTWKDLDRLRKRAGKVRDMDVLTSYASTVHVKGDDCLVQLLEHLGAKRRKLAKKLHRETERLGPALPKGLKRAGAVLAKLIRKNGSRPAEVEAGANAAATAVKLEAELPVPRRLDRKNLHTYRLKVKELRDVLRMADGPSRPKFVDALGEVNDAIGEWHDWEELVSIAEKVLDHGKACGLIPELKRITRDKYDRALALADSLRSKYLRKTTKTPGEPALQAAASLAG